jgi:seryl-tRNA synthetase
MEYIRGEGRMNVNQIKVSGWNPSNLIQPVKVNGDIFKRDKKIIKKIEKEDEDEKKKREKMQKLNLEIENVKKDPVKKLSAEHDDFSYIPRLVPLYRSHFSKYT